MKVGFNNKLKHRNDVLLHRGYKYQGNILKKTLSHALYLEEVRKSILEKLEEPLSSLVDSVKMIKKTFYWALEKDYTEFN